MKEKILNFFNSPVSNICGAALGGALIGLNLLDFNIIGIVGGVFLLVSEGIQYWERT